MWVPVTRSGHDHAAIWYSWMSPPSRSVRRIRLGSTMARGSTGPEQVGACWSSERCGRCSLLVRHVDMDYPLEMSMTGSAADPGTHAGGFRTTAPSRRSPEAPVFA